MQAMAGGGKGGKKGKKSGFDEEEMLEAMMADMMLGGKSKGAKA